ncbi:S8 family serine peptidase [Shewanella submarina]|uniref:S8 family serine peptidase n=1 Tax=Shewanella submarina TaxID=2016376 RepID=A0ABV7GHH2_9GAMM|nr:S8 family serine peptidase [Shewanella submarina]MCL1038089.1 S8 family serine peptidase [Shewanella submarina]
MFNKLAIAISASLMTGLVGASTIDKYQLEQYLDSTQSEETLLQENQGVVAWMVVLNQESVSKQLKTRSVSSPAAAMQDVMASQAKMKSQIAAMGEDIQVLSSTSKLVNGLIVAGDHKAVMRLKKNPDIKKILPVYDRQLHVAASRDYVGATAVANAGGATGAGQIVAVLDTGVDYTHSALGGSGNPDDYAAAVASQATAPSWPQGKVIGGYDFMNDDPNPIDATTNHGTHVSHSVSGIAPDVEFYVYSVCAGGCPGVAQFNALEAAMDPNGDGDTSDHVDVVNMSLGGAFGDNDGDAVELLINEMVEQGINVVISAGNDGPRPFVVGGPSTSKNAMSVGAMTHPVNEGGKIESELNGTPFVAVGAGFNTTNEFAFDSTGSPLVYSTANDNADACDAFGDDIDFTANAVLVDRGGCNFTTKVLNAQNKGADFVIVANNVDTPPFAMGGSNPDVTIPSVMISLADGNLFKDALDNNNAVYSIESESVVLADGIASFTSRGPSVAGLLKPEITAPGVNILTAHPGLGDGLTPASGTSFSGPITAGAVSVVRETFPDRNAFEVKATLMNTANSDVYLAPPAQNPDAGLAPVSYIGAGLVDLERAVESEVIAWDSDSLQAALAFGLVKGTEMQSVTKTVTLKNFSGNDHTFNLELHQRYADDIASGAVSMDMPSSITVGAGSTAEFDVTMHLDPSALPAWGLRSGNTDVAGQTQALTLSEYDGAIRFMQGDEEALKLIYHVLPKADAEASVGVAQFEGETVRSVTNTGATDLTNVFAASLTGVDPVEDERRHDMVGGSLEVIELAGCTGGYAIVNTMVFRDPIIHPLVGSHNVDFDLDQDGTWDYKIGSINYGWFRRGDNRARMFVHGYPNATRGFIREVLHTPGNNFIGNFACFGDMGLSESDIGSEVNIRFRVEEDSWILAGASGEGDEITATVTLEPNDTALNLFDEAGNPISSLAQGESGLFDASYSELGYVMLSDQGGVALTFNMSPDANSAPRVDDLEASVDKGTGEGEVVARFNGVDDDAVSSPIANYEMTDANSDVLVVDYDGSLKVAPGMEIDQSTETMTGTVVAIDTLGNRSEPADFTVTVNNTRPMVEFEEKRVITATGGEVTLTALGTDEDGDELTYEFTQTRGPAVSFTQDDNMITFTAPSVSTRLKFKVKASDGRLESRADNAKVIVSTPPQAIIQHYEFFGGIHILRSRSTDEDGRIRRHRWTFDNGETRSGRVIFYRGDATGVTLEVTDNRGLKDSTSITF